MSVMLKLNNRSSLRCDPWYVCGLAACFEVLLETNIQLHAVGAAPKTVPQPLIDQLAPNGRMFIPVGPSGEFHVFFLVRPNSLHS